jgi:hypothetical protein
MSRVFAAPQPARPTAPVLTVPMSLVGEYRPSPQQWVRDQADLYESSGGTQKWDLVAREIPVVVLEHPADLPGGQPTR